ncbi:MAG: hypothetical protein KY445_14725 [Armatimonadetes bacterium]|nr:hypothetical protein [Armatimonadota bacterium]
MEQQTAQLIGMSIAAIVAGWVFADAKRRGLKTFQAVIWGLGVFLFLIVFFPLYLWTRKQNEAAAPKKATAPIAAPCAYCEYPNVNNPDFCAKCGRQLRSSVEIHHKES